MFSADLPILRKGIPMNTPFTQPNVRRDALHPPLENSTVMVVGLGGGAEIAMHLLRSGISRFHLFDFDTLEAGNLVRHSCGIKYVGKNKASAVAECLHEYAGGGIETIVHETSVFEDHSATREAVVDSDVLIVATDTDSSRFFLNELCVETATPAVFVSMFERGKAGEVFSYRPGQGACFSCLMRHLGRQDMLEEYEKTAEKAQCHLARDVRSMPGIGIDQAFFSALAARKALEILLEGKEHALPKIGEAWNVLSLFGISGVLEEHLSSIKQNPPSFSDCECAVP